MNRRLVADFGCRTGPVHGGAAGMLYGLSDPGVPAGTLIAGARPRTMAQKAPDGAQHPNGDALATATGFFAAGGEEMLVYMQDVYGQWPYQNPGRADYLAKVETMVRAVAARPDAARFSWVPFNEPDWIWYADWPRDRERFCADWAAVHRAIRAILPEARIVGPNEMEYHHDRLADFLGWAAGANLLPDVISWHELKPEMLDEYPAHYADYRLLERSLGIVPRPININEYGNRRDTADPARLIRWIAMFEHTKVDADLAYWTYAGNLDDHAVQTTRANGGWWLLKWYADLTGETVETAARPMVGEDRLGALAAVDEQRRQATVLFGAAAGDVHLELIGLPQGFFGAAPAVTVSKTSWSGHDGDAGVPQVLSREQVLVRDGVLALTVPGGDPMAAYQVVVTPTEREVDPARAPWSMRYEAEHADLTDATVTAHDDDPQKYATSGGHDVSGLTKATSAVTFTVEPPAAGRYTLGVFYGTDGVPARQALYVDDRFDRILTYGATLSHTFRGRLDVPLDLGEGSHRLALRAAGPDGPLADNDVALDRIDLTRSTGSNRTVHPARTARLGPGAVLRTGDPDEPARAILRAPGTATFFVAAHQTGYHDLAVTLSCEESAQLMVAVDGRTVQTADLHGPGGSTTQVRIHLGRGISAVRLSARRGTVGVSAVLLERVPSADRAITTATAARLDRTGTARLVADPYATGGTYLTDLGSGSGSVSMRRPPGVIGQVNLSVGYANGAKNTASHYNTDVISRYARIGESGGDAVTVAFRHTYAWNNFWTHTVGLTLLTDDGALTLGHPDAPAPNIDQLALSPLVLAAWVLPEEILPTG